ncbi:MAG: hypothetical protein H6732_04670 [Alphaproteobacteria bacterium]|nr:hypothetical protein [Alphaproteobacteria bacterium]
MPRRLVLCGVALWAGCRCGPAEAPEPEVRAWAPPSDPEHVQLVRVGTEGRGVAVQFTGVGTLYRSWFGDAEVLAPFVEAVAPCLEPPFELSVTYDEDTRRGRVALVAAAGQVRCPARAADGDLDLAPLTGLARPLADLRNGLAATRDIRIYGFGTALHLEDDRGAVTLWLDGQDPLDGSAFARCLGLDGVERCLADEAPEGLTTLAPAEAPLRRRLATLLGAR